MTDYEKSQIRQLQEKGYGYKKIATTISLSVNAVKGYMRRSKPAEGKCEEETTQGCCVACGKALLQLPHLKSPLPNLQADTGGNLDGGNRRGVGA